MDVLAYSPSVDVIVEMNRNGEISYVDLSPDVVSASVSRKENAASTFSAVLKNDGGKYNGAFACFDKVVVYATKVDRCKVFSGYLTEFDAFKLYGDDFNISAKCPIYRLQKYYWDPGLLASAELLRTRPGEGGRPDSGYAQLAASLLTEVAAWPPDMIAIQEEIPPAAVEWAKKVYLANQDEITQLKDMANEFFDVLRAHGPSLTPSVGDAIATAVSAAAGTMASVSGKDLSGVSVNNIDDLGPELAEQIKKLSKTRQVIISTAVSKLGCPYVWGATGPDTFDCSGLTSYCYRQAGVSIPRVSGDQAGCGRQVPVPEAVPGDIVWKQGHVGLAIGGGNFIHAPEPGDVVKITTWNPWQHAVRVVD